MKTILLASGRSKRMKPVGDKNFLRFVGKSLIEWQLEQLVAAGLQDFVVIGGAHNLAALKDAASDFESTRAKSGVKIAVIEQENLEDGMAGAIMSLSKTVTEGGILIVSCNDMVDAKAFKEVMAAMEEEKCDHRQGGASGAILAKEVTEYFPGGYLELDGEGFIKSIVEKPGEGQEPGNLVNVVIHAFQDCQRLYEAVRDSSSQKDDRYEVALDALMKDGVRFKAVHYDGFWQPVKYPWHVLDVMNHYLGRIGEIFPKGRVGGAKAEVAATATIRGDVYMEEGVKIMDNAVVQGPVYLGKNTIVASNALVRNSHIGDNCVIGFGTEVARSYLGNKVWTHSNYIGDSIIGSNVSFGAGTVTGNLRFDEGHIHMGVRDEKVNTRKNKFGLITGNDVRTAVNSSFMPGIKIGNNVCIGAGIVIERDIEDNKYVTGSFELKEYENRIDIGMLDREAMKKRL